ncbi:MAG TPA: sialate O-acetylesterase, partial [Planctomycetota bacterium]|nr:sialate O-acetylesterase [Planctomycetota bacterium]
LADVRLAEIFGDHMVLQRNSRAHLWGSATPGELIRVRPSWYEHDAAVTAGPDGAFRLALATPEASGPFTIEFTGGGDKVTLSDVMIGDVWLASGQSNMEMGVGYQHDAYSGVENWQKELEDATRPRIRFFTVENTAAPAPVSDVRGAWRVAEPASVKAFSAVAWFFAKELEREQDVAIGIVAADWGGTPLEAWTSARGLEPFAQFAPAVDACAKLASHEDTNMSVHADLKVWGRAIAQQDPLSAAHAERPEFDDRAWPTTEVPAVCKGELGAFDGLVWMRRDVEVPASWAGRAVELDLGPVDDDDRTWFQGELLGATDGWEAPRHYAIDPALVKAGKATIAVRVFDSGGEGGIRGEPAQACLRLSGTKERVSLAGPWRTARGAALTSLPPKPEPFTLGGKTPTALFNGMIAPLSGTALAGVIWYQGESNVGRAAEYAELFPALITDWRAHFQRELPFLFVQIAPFAYGEDTGQAGDLREAQKAALALPATGMAITIDLGDPRDIHPKKKQAVGRRLAELALAPDHRVSFPTVQTSAVDAGSVVLSFGEPLEACGPSVFELAASDGRFFRASQELGTGTGEVRVACPEIPRPARLRYGWGAADGPSLRGSESGLPVAAFELSLP